MVRRLVLPFVVAGAACLAVPAPASAHVGSGTLSTDFVARIAGVRPRAPWLVARVLGGDLRLELTVRPPHVVVVDGVLHEPFLRFSPAGVQVNLASPTATAAGVIPASRAVSGGVAWARVDGGHTYAWHENRLRPVPLVRRASAAPRWVAGWSIPLVVDGRRSMLAGGEWYAAPPSLWSWLVAAIGGLAAAGAVAWLAAPAVQRAVALALLIPAVAALLAGWGGIFLYGRTSPLVLPATAAFALASVAFVVAAVAASRGPSRVGAIALVGGFVAAFSAPEAPVFAHGFVLSALPSSVARGTVFVALVGGLAVGVVCLPALVELFAGSPVAVDRPADPDWTAPRGM